VRVVPLDSAGDGSCHADQDSSGSRASADLIEVDSDPDDCSALERADHCAPAARWAVPTPDGYSERVRALDDCWVAPQADDRCAPVVLLAAPIRDGYSEQVRAVDDCWVVPRADDHCAPVVLLAAPIRDGYSEQVRAVDDCWVVQAPDDHSLLEAHLSDQVPDDYLLQVGRLAVDFRRDAHLLQDFPADFRADSLPPESESRV
jgi:hypothetical protein